MCDDHPEKLKPLGLTPDKVEVLCVRLQDQSALLQTMTRLDVGFFTGVSTGFAIISAWVIGQKDFDVSAGIAVAIFESVMFVVFFSFIYLNQLRRKEATKTIINANEALKLYEPDFYISGKAINPEPTPRFWGLYYKIAGLIIFLGSIFVILNKIGILKIGIL